MMEQGYHSGLDIVGPDGLSPPIVDFREQTQTPERSGSKYLI